MRRFPRSRRNFPSPARTPDSGRWGQCRLDGCRHQGIALAGPAAADGHWSLHEFPLHARKDLNSDRYFDDKSLDKGLVKNDVAGTAFGLLPFLAAGITHKASTKGPAQKYVKTVDAGLKIPPEAAEA